MRDDEAIEPAPAYHPGGAGQANPAVIGGDRMTDDATAATTRAADHPGGPDTPPPVRPAAAETLRLYARDWTSFATWCAAAGLTALPATAATVVAFLTEAAPGLSAGGVPGMALILEVQVLYGPIGRNR
jgi:hypothetical protein